MGTYCLVKFNYHENLCLSCCTDLYWYWEFRALCVYCFQAPWLILRFVIRQSLIFISAVMLVFRYQIVFIFLQTYKCFSLEPFSMKSKTIMFQKFTFAIKWGMQWVRIRFYSLIYGQAQQLIRRFFLKSDWVIEFLIDPKFSIILLVLPWESSFSFLWA